MPDRLSYYDGLDTRRTRLHAMAERARAIRDDLAFLTDRAEALVSDLAAEAQLLTDDLDAMEDDQSALAAETGEPW